MFPFYHPDCSKLSNINYAETTKVRTNREEIKKMKSKNEKDGSER